jgi:UDP-N-acetylglucosamine--N-acetylmuramyl-(pentapeptide) pyrophosphoryl-undecaprenol N-acetylglucosamine transferase
MAEKPLVIIAAGGTGGHMFPANAFADEMRSRGWDVGLISDARGLGYAADFPADWKEEVGAASPNFRKPWTLPAAALKIWRGISSASKLMTETKPALVAGFGGYPAFPALSAARRQKVPILVHEQNAVLGRVNRFFASKADVVASGFERLDRLPAGVLHRAVGNPVRAAIAAKREEPFPPTGGDLKIFITGGSQGARVLGEIIPLALANHVPAPLRARLKIVQQVREEQMEDVRTIYDRVALRHELKPFFSDMPERLSEAHLIIARSGAGTVSEIAAVGRPSILIPLKIAMDDHQAANAEALVEPGAADMLLEDNLYPDLLGELVKVRLEDGEDLKDRAHKARQVGTVTAAADLADLAEQAAGQA